DFSESDVFKDTDTIPKATDLAASDSDGASNYEQLTLVNNSKDETVVDTIDKVKVVLTATSTVDEGDGSDAITYTATIYKTDANGNPTSETVNAKNDVTVTLDNGETITIPANSATGSVSVDAESDDVYVDATDLSVKITDAIEDANGTGDKFEDLDFDTTAATTDVKDTIDTTTVDLSAEVKTEVVNVNELTKGISHVNYTLSDGTRIKVEYSGDIKDPTDPTKYIEAIESSTGQKVTGYEIKGGQYIFDEYGEQLREADNDYDNKVPEYNGSLSENDTYIFDSAKSVTLTVELSNPTDTNSPAVVTILVDGKEETITIPAGETTGTFTFTPENDTFNAKVTNVTGGNYEDVDFDDATVNIDVDSPSSSLKVGITGEYTNVYYGSDHAGYSNSLLTYELDENGNPTNPKLIMLNSDDGLSVGDILASYGNPNIKFLLIADGADRISSLEDAELSFDNSTGHPKLIVDGKEIDQKITIYQDKDFNVDGKEHFIIEDNDDGTQTIKIEDLPNNGDKDFDDLIITTQRVTGDDIDVTEGYDGYYVIDLKDENGNIVIAQEDITVTLTYTGTAVDGQDYTKEITVTIPKGSGHINLDVSTIDDNFYENKENYEIQITSISPDIDTISIDENRDTVNTDIIDDDSNNKDVVITLDSPDNVDENATKATYTISVTNAPQSDLKVVVNINDEPREVTIKAGETSATFDLEVREDDKYKDDDDTFNAEIISHSGGSYEGNVSYNNDDNTFKVTDDVDPVDVTVTAVATSPKVIDVDTEFGDATGVNIAVYDKNGNPGTLSVVKGTNHDGFGVDGNTSGGGAKSELGYGSNGTSEKIVFDFTNDVDSLDVAFAWRNNHETAKITFSNDGQDIGYATVAGGGKNTDATVKYYDMDGNLIKEVSAQGGTDRVDLSYTFEFPDENGNPMAFDKAEFSAPGHDDDYLIHKVSYTEVIDPEITNINTSEGKITFNIQVDEDYPPQGSAKAIVEVNGTEYEVELNATGRGTLTLDAKDFNDLSNVEIKVKDIIGGNYEDVKPSTDSFDLSGSFTDDFSSTDDSITINEDETYVLTETDFGEYGEAVKQFKITELPSEGTLYLTVHKGEILIDKEGNTYTATEDTKIEITEGQIISLANIAAGNVTYEPEANSDADTSFKFQIGDEDGNFKDVDYTTDIEVIAVADAPTASIDVSGGIEKTVVIDNKGGNNGFGNGDQNAPGNSEHNNNAENAGGNQQNITFDLVKIGETTFSIENALQNVNTHGTNGDDVITYNDIAGGSNINSNGGNDIIAITGDINGGAVAGGTGVDLLYLAKAASKYEILNYNGPEQGHDNIDCQIKDLDTGEILTVNNIEGIVFGDGTTKGDAEVPDTGETVIEYDVDFSAELSDLDGSESLTVTITNVPTNAELTSTNSSYTLTNNNDGTWTVNLPEGTKDVDGSIKMTVPKGTENIDLGITARATETRDNDDGTNYKEANDSDALVYVDDESKTLDFEANTVKGSENIIIVLDISGSMNDNVKLEDGTWTTRLALAKEALENMIDTYEQYSNIKVNLTKFSATADDLDGSGSENGWYSAEDALNIINNMSAGGQTNYEDALEETYTDYVAPENGEKATIYFISDGKPNVENDDSQSGLGEAGIIDSRYLNKWKDFLEENAKELNVIGIGKGITNSTYLDMVAQNVGNVKTNVTIIENENDLKDKLVENVYKKVDGNILDNISGGDGEKTIDSIVVDGVTYTIADSSNNILSVETSSGGVLEFNFETGDYSFGGLRSNIVEESESFIVNVSDENGDTANFDVNIDITNTVDTVASAPTLSFSVEANGEVEIPGSSSMDLTFDEWDGSNTSSNSIVLNNLGTFDDLKGDYHNDKVLINNNIDGDIYTYSGKDEVVIDGNVYSNSKIETSSGEDNITVKGNISGDIDTGSQNDKVQIEGNVNSYSDIVTASGNDEVYVGGNVSGDIDTGSQADKVQIEGNVTSSSDIVTEAGDDEVYVGGNISGDIDTGSQNDKVHIKGNVNSYSEISLGSGNDMLQIDGRVYSNNISGGWGNDSIILNGYTKEEYDNNVGCIQDKVKDFENIKVGDTVVKGNSDVFNSLPTATTTVYSYTITLAAILGDLDGSESLSQITLDNIPSSVSSIKDSDGTEYTVSNGTVTLPNDEGNEHTYTFISSDNLTSSQINSMSASVTSTEKENGDTNTITENAKLEIEPSSNMTGTDADEKFDSQGNSATINAGAGDDEIIYNIGDTVDGGEGEDTLKILENDDIDLSDIKSNVNNIEEIDLTNDFINELIVDEQSIEDLTDDENILKIFGDSGDKVMLEGGADNWVNKGTETDSDGNTFNVYQGTSSATANVTVLIDDDVSIESDI
ncbi:MAG: VWA domain-containing protein, partial [Campylobacteraceae bacterium]|nr:VWA domain-containing protein [Campylobacteraceae bacterium]